MEKDIIDTSIIDPNIDSYVQFFDHRWAEGMFDAVEASPLREAVNSLVVAWRSANGAHLLPWLMVNSLRRFAEGEGIGSLRFRASYSGEVIKGLVADLESRMQYSLDRDQRAILKRVVAKIEEEAHEALKTAQAKEEFPIQGYWDLLINTSEFQFSIL
ncbi:MAG TPA: hypothetical protein VG125_00150, partial [Pirellulales bacterium]|nr:hypothetical protein [Pirellulales bacterium]